MIKIYNTLTGKKEDFKPIVDGEVRMYVCGPTVYDFIHIGNARPIIVFDVVRRYFEYKGYKVNFVSNFTDVDDKIIAKANAEGVSATAIAEKFILACKDNMKALNVKEATYNPRATEEIDEMQSMINSLIQNDFAYEKNGSVFFRTRKFKDYGKLSNKNIDDLISGARIDIDSSKEDPLDFVLWKPKKDGEIAWESPWGEGRPGWHIECSVMSKKYLGEEIDIHAGGEDLIFPHHENEIAQSEACSHKTFAKYWMHNGFLKVDNRKMSKSLGNFYTINDVLERFDGQIIRLFMLSSNYHGPINFSFEALEATKTSLERLRVGYENLLSKKNNVDTIISDFTLLESIKNCLINFEVAMDNDFNTADAITQLFELTRICNSNINCETSKKIIDEALKIFDTIKDTLGIVLARDNIILDEEIKELIKKRTMAKKERNFALADEIRAILLDKNIVLEDTREGVRWKRI